MKLNLINSTEKEAEDEQRKVRSVLVSGFQALYSFLKALSSRCLNTLLYSSVRHGLKWVELQQNCMKLLNLIVSIVVLLRIF